MARMLFWNINGKPLLQAIKTICNEQNIDIFIAAEMRENSRHVLSALQEDSRQKYYEISPLSSDVSRLNVYSRYPIGSIVPLQDDFGFSIYRVRPPIGLEFLMVSVHFPSKLAIDASEQAQLVPRVARALEIRERELGHDRTLVIGDLNMNPFEIGVVSSEGLHAVMDRGIARKGARQVYGEERKFFYNPMWGKMGDLGQRVPGTYFYNKNAAVSYFWNTFDQAMLRPSLLDYFDDDGLQVITMIGKESLLEKGRLNSKFSDHLPIVIDLSVEYEVNHE